MERGGIAAALTVGLGFVLTTPGGSTSSGSDSAENSF